MGQSRKQKKPDEGVSGDQLSQVADALEGKDDRTVFGKLGAEGEIDESDLTSEEIAAREAEKQRAVDAAEFDAAEEKQQELPPLNLGPLDQDASVLRGDIVDMIMDNVVRRMTKPWTEMGSFDQASMLHRVNEIASASVRRSIGVLADAGFPFMAGEIGKVSIDKMLEIKFEAAANQENLTTLVGHTRGAEAIIVFADPAAYMGARKEQKPMPDQQELPIGEQTAHDAETGEVRETVGA